MKQFVSISLLAISLVGFATLTMLGCRISKGAKLPAAEGAKLPEWVLYNTNNSHLPHGDGYMITFDAQGNAWRGTEFGGVAKTDGLGDWLFYNTSNSGLPTNDVICIAFDSHGNAWMGTWGWGVAKFDGAEGWTVYDTSNSELPDNHVANLAIDDEGNVWMATHGGLAKFDSAEEWTVYNASNSGLPGDYVRAVVTDGLGNVWISAHVMGLAKFDGEETWVVYTTSNSGLHSHYFAYCALAFDPDGNLWIGTESAGAVKFDGAENWTVYNTSNSGLPDDFVNGFAFDDQGNVWMATQGGGVAKFDGEKAWTVYDTSNSELPINSVWDVAVDTHGNLWIGTGGAHDSGVSRGGVAVYREGGVVPLGLGPEFAHLTSATTTFGSTKVGQPTPLEVAVVFDTPMDTGKSLRLDLSPLGPDLPLEYVGEGRYTGRITVTPLRNAHYNLPVIVQTAEGVRYRFFLATLDVYPVGNLVVYNDVPGEGWTVDAWQGESDLASTAFVRTGNCSHAFGPGRVDVDYLYEDPEGIDLFGYSHLEFFVNGGESFGQNLAVSYTSLKKLGIVPEADNWTQVTIPVSDLPSPLRAIRISGSLEESLYIDDMRLVAGEFNIKKK